jgi:hypothetical protein
MTRRSWNGTDPVVGIDIDGTLGRYHEHFLGFARQWFGTNSNYGTETDRGWAGPKAWRDQSRWWGDFDYDGSCPLNEYMGVSKARYRQCKLAYRRGGLKRSMPVYKGARELLVGLRRKAWVVLCTTRPYLHMDNIEPDTVEWLRRNKMPYDALLMGEHKYRDLRRQYGERVAAVLDDDPALLSQAQSLSPAIPALFMVRNHNIHYWEAWPWWENSCQGALLTLTEHVKNGSWMLGIQPKN